MASLAEQFLARFPALDRWHGQYDIAQANKSARGKLEGQAWGKAGPATVELWQAHLDGKLGLGLCPILDNGTCYFAALDIDVYNLDLAKLAQDAAQFPLVPARTKSGGCHLYLFGAEALPARLVRERLAEWSVVLGFGGCEIFPKQEKLASKNDLGNWINMPYFGGAFTTRYALDTDGRALSMEEFLVRADAIAVTALQLGNIRLAENPLEEGPPCLQTLCKSGFPEGTRNEALFNLAVYARKRYDEWEPKVEEYNETYMQPPLGAREVTAVVRSVRRKVYFYRCSNHPLVGVCNKQLCLTRKYGIGNAADDVGVEFGELAKVETDPPTWILTVNGINVELTTAELLDQRLCRARVLETANVLLNGIKNTAWTRLIRDRVENVQVQPVPRDVLPAGQWEFLLQEFCTGRVNANALDEILLGRPYTCPVEKRTFFRAADFTAYIKRQHFKFDDKKVFGWLKKIKAHHHSRNIKGKFTNYWSVPEFSKQTEEFAVAKVEEGI